MFKEQSLYKYQKKLMTNFENNLRKEAKLFYTINYISVTTSNNIHKLNKDYHLLNIHTHTQTHKHN